MSELNNVVMSGSADTTDNLARAPDENIDNTDRSPGLTIGDVAAGFMLSGSTTDTPSVDNNALFQEASTGISTFCADINAQPTTVANTGAQPSTSFFGGFGASSASPVSTNMFTFGALVPNTESERFGAQPPAATSVFSQSFSFASGFGGASQEATNSIPIFGNSIGEHPTTVSSTSVEMIGAQSAATSGFGGLGASSASADITGPIGSTGFTFGASVPNTGVGMIGAPPPAAAATSFFGQSFSFARGFGGASQEATNSIPIFGNSIGEHPTTVSSTSVEMIGAQSAATSGFGGLGASSASANIDIYNGLGRQLMKQGKLDEAKVMLHRALQGKEKALGPNHTDTLRAVDDLADLLDQQGKLEEAQAMWDRALRGREKTLGPDHTDTLRTVYDLASLLEDQGKLDEAQAMYDRALRGYEKVLGPDHTSTLGTVANLAALLSDQGKFDEAKVMFDRVLQGYEQALGPDHTDSLDTVDRLGRLLYYQGKLEEAKAMWDRALQGKEKALGPNHPSTLSTVDNLADLLDQQGKLNEAKALYQRCYEGYVKIYGANHSKSLHAKAQVDHLKKKAKDTKMKRTIEARQEDIDDDDDDVGDDDFDAHDVYEDEDDDEDDDERVLSQEEEVSRAFFKAVEEGDVENVQSVVTKVDINAKGKNDETALHKAAAKGHEDIVKLLLTLNADVNIPNVSTLKTISVHLMCISSIPLSFKFFILYPYPSF